jgi:hypothetical protein
MYSFDHDLGHFVSIGPATVSADGQIVASNPGVGILKAGWHCGGDPAGIATTHACPLCNICDGSQCVPGCSLESSASTNLGALASISAASCTGTCSDNDPCTANDRCQGGRCQGDPKRIHSVTALANGLEEAVVGLPGAVSFTALVDHEHCGDREYSWDFGDGAMSVDPAPVHAYGFPGEYVVSLRVTCRGCPQTSRSDNANVKVVFVDVQFADVTQDRIEVVLAPPTVSGTLTLELVDPGSHVIRSEVRSGGGYTESFDIPGLTPGEYSQVKATWEVDGVPVVDGHGYRMEVLGNYRHSQYNTPDEANCTGALAPAYVTTGGQTTSQCFNNPNLFYNTTLPSDFISQVNLNGSGTTTSFGLVQIDAFCPQTTGAPNDAPGKTFRQTTLQTACGNSSVDDTTVAACLKDPPLDCGDQVFIHGVGIKTVTDNCPGCCGRAQLDNFTTLSGCLGVITDIGNFMTIKVSP